MSMGPTPPLPPPMPMPMFMPPGAPLRELLTLPPTAGPKPHSHLECGGCRTLLMYPQGAGNVRCSRCTHITPVPPASTEAAQIVCNGCRVLLSYPKGAQSVQCSMCHVVTQKYREVSKLVRRIFAVQCSMVSHVCAPAI
eukprot:1160781-Pelagomonas_calceolata.AAC.23